MPFKTASKRSIEEIVAAEDSNDDDYDDRASGPSRSRSSKPRRGGTSQRKKPRRGYRGSDVSEDDDDVGSDDEEPWTEEDEPEEVQTSAHTGRPLRRTAKKAVTYEENSDDDDDDDDEADAENKDEDELTQKSSDDDDRVPKTARAPKVQLSKVVRLKLSTPLPLGQSHSRSTRDRRSTGSKPTTPTEGPVRATRHSRRLSHDEEEPVMQLSSSGRHVEYVRDGSREPLRSARPTRGSKGIKYPSKSTIDEAEEPASGTQERGPAARDEEEDEAELEIKASQPDAPEEPVPRLLSDLPTAADDDSLEGAGNDTADPIALSEALSTAQENIQDDEDEDDQPIRSRGRLPAKRKAQSPPAEEPAPGRRKLRDRASANLSQRSKPQHDQTSDFDPEEEVDDGDPMSEDEESDASPQKSSRRHHDDSQSSNGGRRSTRLRKKAESQGPSEDELAEELAELTRGKKEERRQRQQREQEDIVFEPRRGRGVRKNYDLLRNMPQIEEDDEAPVPSPSQRARKAGAWQRRELLSTYGPFGGAASRPVLGGPARLGDDSDSSDDEIMKQPKPVAGLTGMTPITATSLTPFALQPLNSDPAQAPAGTPANLGKIKDKQALADADPLGVDQNVNFDGVGGLQGHIDQLKEMVALPLLYPEIFMRFKITPPRGVLFHGPPGTGKTLLARALATSVSSQGRKVTFYMRKGADALSKWVGEAERQLRMLFEEARKTQPSIIFFDEIDGLAPVRSSKQEQIHASIVSTLLALMDGMDGRGQVIVIGATNRPDSIDPALRRPGRFDREFYFPLPDVEARRSIIQIHTRGWNPPLDDQVKDELAVMTKGYGGADLRALCTEAALNAVQRRYPQIYRSKEKLLIDPKSIEVTPKDFMIAIKHMTPSSERSAASGAAPLPDVVVPLLHRPLKEIQDIIAEVLPRKKKTTALEEAQFEDVADGRDFGREKMQQVFEESRVFRPRLLVHGRLGMGQQYVAAALLNHFQGLHVQSFDLATLLSDTSSTPEATVIRLFAEVKTHRPSVIYIPNVSEWYATVSSAVLTTFLGLLRSLKPSDPILVLGFCETDIEQEDGRMRQDFFGFSKRNQYLLEEPRAPERVAFFAPLERYITMRPNEFPDPTHRNRRPMETLALAPPEAEQPSPPPSREELKAQKKKDRHTLNLLKIRLQLIMDQIRTKYKRFRTGVIDESHIRYLYEEADEDRLTSDAAGMAVAVAERPFEVGHDAHGVPGLVEQATGKFFYNIDSVIIEKRLSNGYYKRPKDFLADVKRLAKDAKTIEDEERLLKANELLANVEVDVTSIEIGEPTLAQECERVYQRELKREKEAQEKARAAQGDTTSMPPPPPQVVPDINGSISTGTTDTTGAIQLGLQFKDARLNMGRVMPVMPVTPVRQTSHHSGSAVTNGHHPNSVSRPSTGSGNDADAEVSHHTSTSKPSDGTQRTHTTTTSSSFGHRDSAQPKPYLHHSAPSQQLRHEMGIHQQLSQTDFVTPMQAGSQPADYINEASTTQTTSGQKHSSNNTNGQISNTQESGPNLYMFDERRDASGGENIPDTQDNPIYSQSSVNGSGSSQSQHYTTARGTLPTASTSQAAAAAATAATAATIPPPVPTFSTNPLSAVLNPPFEASTYQPSTQQISPSKPLLAPLPNLQLPTPAQLANILTDLADKTSGLSVEQLEQCNAALMETIWRTKGEWDRRVVLDELVRAFNAVLADMRAAGQEFGDLSWNTGLTSRRIEG